MAAPHVAGGAAVILEARPQINPKSLKDLLKRTADSSRNTSAGRIAPFAVDPTWVPDFGSGIMTLHQTVVAALESPFYANVAFRNCVGPPETTLPRSGQGVDCHFAVHEETPQRATTSSVQGRGSTVAGITSKHRPMRN
jgi:hypothetical protein